MVMDSLCGAQSTRFYCMRSVSGKFVSAGRGHPLRTLVMIGASQEGSSAAEDAEDAPDSGAGGG